MKRLSRRILSFTTRMALLASITAASNAAPFDAPDDGTWTVSPAFTSKYVYRGVELAGA